MDVESLAKELILKNMTPEQQIAVLDSVKASVAQAKEVQKRKIGENVDLVVQALKKIESDIRSRYDDVGNAIEKRVASIKDGRDGADGRDGRDGKDGKNGRDGAKGDKGERGQDGRDGINGVDGVSVTNARIDFDGSLVITLSTGVELNVGEVVAPDLAESIKVISNGGGTSQYVLDTLSSLQTQITNLIPSQTGNSGKYLTTNGSALSWASIAGGGLSYQGTWNASTNTPTLTSSSGTSNYYYIVSVAGSTNLNGITDWKVGDWAIYNGTAWQKIDQTETLQTITSTDGSVTVTTTGSTADLSVAVAASTTNVICQVRNTTGATLTKGTVVYITGATGQLPTVSKALATGDSTSAQTLGVMSADLANNSNGYVTIIGLVADIDTSAYTDGAQLYLSPTTAGTYTTTKPYAPSHLVYVAVVEYAHAIHGKLFVKVQNGYELDELHNVSAQSPSNGQTIIYNATTSLWEKGNLTAGTGISVSNGAGSITVANTGVTSVTGTSPVASSGGATPAISLASGYGDTQNPYASKTANYVLAAPNGSAGVPTFRAIVAADIPTLNQNTTGNAGTVTNGAYVNVANTFSANQIISITDNTNAALRVTQLGTGNALLIEDSANPDATPFVVDATGVVIKGTTASYTSVAATTTITPAIQVHGTSLSPASKAQFGWGVTPYYTFNESAGGIGTYTAITINDNLGIIQFNGADGTSFVGSSQIRGSVDTAVSTGIVSGRLTFWTASSAGTLTEQMRIDSSGNVGIGTTSLSALLTVNSESNSTAYNGTATDGQLTAGATQLIRAGAGANTNVAQLVFQSRASQPFNRIVSSGGTAPFMAFVTNNAEALRIASNGVTTIATGYGLSISATGVTSPATTDGNVFSGSYTPTFTNTTNISSSTPVTCYYTRVGNVVSVFGRVDVTATATGNTVLGVSLPIASNLTTNAQLSGTVATTSATVANNVSGRINGDTTNDRAQVQWNSALTTSVSYSINFSYVIV